MNSKLGYVYAIENTVNNHLYIGSTTNYKARWHTHRSSLRKNKHHSFILQKAWNKYGEHSFKFKLLLICSQDQRLDYENRLMSMQDYNVLKTAREQLVRGGWKHSEEFKNRMSVLHKGKVLSEEHRKKLSEAAKKRVISEDFRQKARSRQLGVSPSEITRQKLSDATKLARKSETDDMISKSKLVYEAVVGGATLKSACKCYKISPPTFYKYASILKLVLIGHKNRGKNNELF